MSEIAAITYNSHYMFENDSMNFDFPVELHVARFANNQFITNADDDYTIPFENPDAFKVYLNSTEPVTSPNRESINTVIKNANQYDLILTTDNEIISSCPNAKMFLYGTTWLNKGKIDHPDGFGEYDESVDDLSNDKIFEISFLCSNHSRSLEGYDIRKDVWSRKNEITNPILFYSSTRHPISPDLLPDDDKKHLFNSQFHIAIESSSVPNYFTEKLIDSFITKTVPIYWGCPNIGEFFDVNGMIIVNEESDIIDICNNITPETYESMLPHIEENYRRAKQYARRFSDRVIQKIVNEKNRIDERKNPVLLSIGICSLKEREESLRQLLEFLGTNTPDIYRGKIEIVVSQDSGEKTVGHKRNEIISSANGRFVCFVDDDDKVSEDYIRLCANAITNVEDLDCIGFSGMYYVNGIPKMTFNHANRNAGHYKDENGIQYRPINHLNPVRTSIARQIGFPEKNFGEDSDYCDVLFSSNLLEKEVVINKVLYHYFYNDDESRTQGVAMWGDRLAEIRQWQKENNNE